MIFFNAQWQGAGLEDTLRAGANYLKGFFENGVEVPLSSQTLETKNNIIAYEAILEQMQSFRALIEKHQPEKLITIGGDCGVEVLPITYLQEKHQEAIGLIWLDAHADLNTPESSPSKTYHGMPLRVILGEGDKRILSTSFNNLKPHQVLCLGVRDLDEPEQAYIQNHHLFHTLKLNYPDLRAALKTRNLQKLYIHLDLDVLAPEAFPHTLFPTPGGFSTAEVEELLQSLHQDFDILGLGLTESTATRVEEVQPIQGILGIIQNLERA